MQRWEYLFVVSKYERDHYRPLEVNGEELRDWRKGPTLYDYSNAEQGWELVSVSA